MSNFDRHLILLRSLVGTSSRLEILGPGPSGQGLLGGDGEGLLLGGRSFPQMISEGAVE